MPVISIMTNAPLSANQRDELGLISATVATMLGKPESYVMVFAQYNPDMLFGGTDEPCAYVECKSIGLPAEKTAEYSRTLCELLESTLHVSKNRIYIEFADAQRRMFGWNGGTF